MLSAYRVLDLSDERGLACGQILADLGADVIQVEPPDGSSARRVGPFYKGERDPERSLHWWAFSRGKRSVALDLDDPDGQRALRRLVEGADFLIESEVPGAMAARGLGYDDLAALNPRLVYVSVTPFGGDGPKAHYAATDLIVQASAGAMTLTGDPDRPPLRTGGVSAWSYAGVEAAGAALIAHYGCLRSGRGQHVDVSAQLSANLAAGFTLLSGQIGHARAHRSGGGVSAGGTRIPFIWEAADGFVSLTLAFDPVNLAFSRRLLKWICEEGGCDAETRDRDWPSYLAQAFSGQTSLDVFESLKESIAEFLRARTKRELLEAAAERSLLLVPVATLDDVLASPQLESRDYWRDLEHEDVGAVRYPGPFVKLSRTPIRYDRRPPHIGEHTDDVLNEVRTPAAAAPGGPEAALDARPLAGLKILDFMWVMAGPYTTRVLSDYGATVVKVESAGRIDLVRVLPPFYGGQLGLDTSAAFGSINAGKLSLALDLRKPEAREVVLDLVQWADVVAEAFSPKAMANWGFDYESLRAHKPDLIMLSTCLFGQTGPISRMAGYGTMGAALGGLVQPTGWPDRPPTGPWGPYSDWIAPRFSVPTLLAALDHRGRTGEGQYIDQSQAESALHFMAPAVLDCALNGHALDRVANADPQMAPHGVYPARGEDEWVAIAARDLSDWERLCRALERPELSADPRFASLEARLANAAALDEAIATWTRERPALEIERLMQGDGIPAHIVMHTDAAVDDPQLQSRGHFVEVEHAARDRVLVESTRFRLSRTPARVERGGPTIGQDTDSVLRDLLGYSDERIESLRAAGALG